MSKLKKASVVFKQKRLTRNNFYNELIKKENLDDVHPDFIETLVYTDQKKMYNFFDQQKINKAFFSESIESSLFFNKMLDYVNNIPKNFSDELIYCINLVLGIKDDNNEKIINFKTKLYLNIFRQFINFNDEKYSLLKKINTTEEEMILFFHKYLNRKMDFNDLTDNFKTIKSRIYFYYQHTYWHYKNNEDGSLSKLKPHESAVNIVKSIAKEESFQNRLLKELNIILSYRGSRYHHSIGEALIFVNIADLVLLKKLKELLEKQDVYTTAKEKWFIEEHYEHVENLEKLDMKIIKEEQKYLNSIVKTDAKKKMNNRL